MTDDTPTDFDIWRDYSRGKVGVQLEGLPRRLLTPDEARDRADELDANAPDYLTYPEEVSQVEDIAERLREYANDIESAGDA